MKKLLAMVLALALTVLLFGCTSEQPAETDTEVTLSSEEVDSSLSTDSGTQESDLPTQIDSAPLETDSASDPVSTEENVDLPADFSQIDLNVDVSYKEDFLTFHSMQLVTLQSFLDQPSIDLLYSSDVKRTTIQFGQTFYRDSLFFSADFGAIAQFATPELLEKHLKRKGVEADVKHVFLIDVPGFPVFAWVAGEDYNGIVAFDFSSETRRYVEIIYTFEEFRQKYRPVSAIITLNGQPIRSNQRAVYSHNCADIPLFAVLKGLGAIVSEPEGNFVQVQYNGVNYTWDLEKKCVKKEDEDWDSLIIYGGWVFRYLKNGDFRFDNSSLAYALEYMTGAKVVIEKGHENWIVNIVFAPKTSPSEKNCKLIVKGKDITSEAFVHLHEESGYVDLPITAIMEELGATVVWKDGIVTISLEDKTTSYDTTIPYFGMPLPPGGTYMAREVIAGDLVLDDIAVRSLLKAWTGTNIYVDKENKIVEIK